MSEESHKQAYSSLGFATLLGSRGGNAQALEDLLQALQPYLLSVARHELPSHLRDNIDLADLVQETLLGARRDLAEFQGTDSGAFGSGSTGSCGAT